METEEESKARLVKMVAATQLMLALEVEDDRSLKNGMDWIFYSTRRAFLEHECARSPCNGNHFSS